LLNISPINSFYAPKPEKMDIIIIIFQFFVYPGNSTVKLLNGISVQIFCYAKRTNSHIKLSGNISKGFSAIRT